jgi:predicted nucleic acid-binding Zn ribbon protein
MKLEACRDCGEPVPTNARGCPKCARNLEAERMITKYVLLVVVAVLLLLLLCLAALFFAQ